VGLLPHLLEELSPGAGHGARGAPQVRLLCGFEIVELESSYVVVHAARPYSVTVRDGDSTRMHKPSPPLSLSFSLLFSLLSSSCYPA